MSEKNNKLELWVSEKLKLLDKYARPSKASGASTEIGDIQNKIIYVECKEKHNKANIIVDYKKEWIKTLNEIPLHTHKPVIIFTENKHGDKFATMNAEDFFELLYQANKE